MELEPTRSRALVTARQRAVLAFVADVDDDRVRYARYEVRRRLDELTVDAAILKRHHPDLFDRLREAVERAAEPADVLGEEPLADREDVDEGDVRRPPDAAPDPGSVGVAVTEALDFLRQQGTATDRAIRDAVFDRHPVGYDSSRVWFREVVEPSLRAHPAVVAPEGAGRWRYAPVLD